MCCHTIYRIFHMQCPWGNVFFLIEAVQNILNCVTTVHNIALGHLTVICPHITQFRIPARHAVDSTARRIPAQGAFDSSNKVINSPDFITGAERCARDRINLHFSIKLQNTPPNKHTFHLKKVKCQLDTTR